MHRLALPLSGGLDNAAAFAEIYCIATVSGEQTMLRRFDTLNITSEERRKSATLHNSWLRSGRLALIGYKYNDARGRCKLYRSLDHRAYCCGVNLAEDSETAIPLGNLTKTKTLFQSF